MSKPKKIAVKYIETKTSTKVKRVNVKKAMEEKVDADGCAFC